jgi:hypothetical protein
MTGLTTRPVARRGWWLAFARSAWVVLALVVLGLFVRGAPILWQHLQVVCSPGACPAYGMYAPFAAQLAAVGLSPQVLATYLTLLDGFGVVVYLAVAGD